MRYRVRHTTSYRYEENVALSHNAARLVPRADGRQRLFSSVTTVTPRPAVGEQKPNRPPRPATDRKANDQEDPFHACQCNVRAAKCDRRSTICHEENVCPL